MRTSTDFFIIHCADTPKDMDIGVHEIRRWHVEENGWADIGYHFVIKRDGTVEAGRDQDAPGAHARNYNDKSIGICLVGGKPTFNFTTAQMQALDTLCRTLRVEYPTAKIIGHNEVATKPCPMFDARAWAEGI